jgi:hypothetical protein
VEAARFAFNRSDSFHESATWTVLTPLAVSTSSFAPSNHARTHPSGSLLTQPARSLRWASSWQLARKKTHAAVHGNLASYHIQCGHHPIMLFRPNVRTAIRADVPNRGPGTRPSVRVRKLAEGR